MNSQAKRFSRKPLIMGVASALALTLSCHLQADTKSIKLDIKSQQTGPAMMDLAVKTNSHIMVPQGVGADLQLPSLSGEYTLSTALDALLEGTGLVYEFISEDSVVIKKETPDEQQEKEKEVDEEIVVTGSRIARTPSQMAANVLVLDGDELRASGESTLEGALRRLPQNMFGASPVGAALPGSMSVNGAVNITAASTINLRGLGSESTLILVDGRRIGKSGVFGGVSDITGIPFKAIERVEILLDGASSIYGSDAVGGVVNVIMKKDYDGYTEITHEYGTPEQGGFEEHIFTASSGFTWSSGQLRAVYEHFQSSNLDGEERPESIDSSFYHSPGLVRDLAILNYQGQSYFPLELSSLLGLPAEPWFLAFLEPGVDAQWPLTTFLPDDQDGTNLSFNDFAFSSLGIGDRINSDASEGISLLPAQQRDSLNLDFEQALNLLGNEITLSGTAYYSQRESYVANGGFTFDATVSESNSFNPFGQPANLWWYIPSLAQMHYETDERIARWNLALDGMVGEKWRWTVTSGQSRGKIDSNYFNEQINPANPSDNAIYNQLLSEGLNLFASDIVAANEPELLAQLVKPEAPVSTVNEESILEARASGTLFNLPGGSVHFAFGVDWRQEALETESSRSVLQSPLNNSAVGVIARDSLPGGAFSSGDSSTIESKTQRSGHVELLLPLIGADNAMTGMERLTLTGSARYDSYHEQGGGSTWSLGLIWNPVDQVMVRVNQSTSFLTPSFRDRLAPVIERDYSSFSNGGLPQFIYDMNNQIVGVEYVRKQVFGGNPDLEPQTGSAQSVQLQIAPDFLPGLNASVTWRQTEYINQIGSPATSLVDGVDYVALYPNISRDEQGFLIIDRRAVNIGALETAGVDYLLRYNRDTAFGQFNALLNVGYTSKYDRIQVPGADPLSQLDDISIRSNTVIPATRYNAHFGWYYRGLSVNFSADTASKTVSTGSGFSRIEQRTVKPALKINLTMIYDFEQGNLLASPTWLEDMAVKLAVLNVLDDHTETSLIDLATGEPSVLSELNANVVDPRGRMFKLSVTKRF